MRSESPKLPADKSGSSALEGVIVGAGYFAGFQAEAWQRVSGVQISAVADALPDRARAFAEKWSIPRAYSDAAEMIAQERPDFVDIATRPEAHLSLARLAAQQGVHVICQKPLSPSWEDSVAVVRACRERGVRCLVHENWRFQPWFRLCRRLMDEGTLGRVFYAGFRMRSGDGRGPEPYTLQPYFRQMPRLLVYEAAIHYLDTFRFLVGEIESVFCRTQRLNPLIAGEDFALIQVAFATGAAGLIDANRIVGPHRPEIAVGTLWIEGERGALRMTPDGQIFLTEYAEGRPERPVPYQIPSLGYRGDSVRAVQEHLAESLRSAKPAESEGEEYLKTTASVFACYQSAETGLPVSPQALLRAASP